MKFSVNISKNVWKCWVCSKSGKSLYYLVRRFGTPDQIFKWTDVGLDIDFSFETQQEKTPVKLPEHYYSLITNEVHPLSVPARDYLKERHVSNEDILKFKIGYCPTGQYGHRIVFPSFNLQGDLDFWIGRSYDKNKFPPYLYPTGESKDLIFNELFFDWSKDIVIVEGIFDAIVAQTGIPLLGSTLRENSYIFQRISSIKDQVFIALDPDAKKKENAIIKMFIQYGLDVYKIDVHPFKDVGEMTKEEFQKRKNEAKLRNAEGLEKKLERMYE